MGGHGSESYFVLGEGLLGQDGDAGRAEAAAVEAAATDEPPGAEAAAAAQAAAVPRFRFTRMGPRGTGRQPSQELLSGLAGLMTSRDGPASQIPAGFTYLGQFVDHDLTFDRTSVMLGDDVSPAQLLQGRSPSLDLDSVYGAGPAQPRSARFYDDDGVHLAVGSTAAADGLPGRRGFDLPRGAGSTLRARRRAVIPDPRNDENLAVAQTHLAFIRFHNRVVDTLPDTVPEPRRFAHARGLVVKHYQWMLRTDYLPRICAAGVLNDVFSNGRKVFEASASPLDVPTMPIEFSVAAFRLGHAMVRTTYNWNRIFDDGAGSLDFLFLFSAASGDLGGGPRLPANWVADFRRLFDFGEAGRADLAVPAAKFNRAMRIDTTLVPLLATLPRQPASAANLALRNLTRAKMVQLATGQQMVAQLKRRGVDVTPLTGRQIVEGNGGVDLGGLPLAQRKEIIEDTPLWFYILREAEFNSGRLGGVGARIVAETFHRAMEGSRASIVRDPGWRPSLGPDQDTFRMVDLLLHAFEGRRNLLAPVG